jgi:hypothetical protein
MNYNLFKIVHVSENLFDFANPLMQMGTLNVELGAQQTWPLTIQETGFSNYYISYSLSFARTTQTSSV